MSLPPVRWISLVSGCVAGLRRQFQHRGTEDTETHRAYVVTYRGRDAGRRPASRPVSLNCVRRLDSICQFLQRIPITHSALRRHSLAYRGGMSLPPGINLLTWTIIGCAIAVHKALGPGLLESAYRACLIAELRHAGLRVEVEVRVPIVYRGTKIDCGYRIDLIVEGTVILEIKSIAAVLPIHEAQLMTYLRLTDKPLGLLLNFNVPVMKDGILRRVNTPEE